MENSIFSVWIGVAMMGTRGEGRGKREEGRKKKDALRKQSASSLSNPIVTWVN